MAPTDSLSGHVVSEGERQTNLQAFITARQGRQRVRHAEPCHGCTIERFRAGRIRDNELWNAAIAVNRKLYNRAAAPRSHANAFRNDSSPIRPDDRQDLRQVGLEIGALRITLELDSSVLGGRATNRSWCFGQGLDWVVVTDGEF